MLADTGISDIEKAPNFGIAVHAPDTDLLKFKSAYVQCLLCKAELLNARRNMIIFVSSLNAAPESYFSIESPFAPMLQVT
eukprot:scaffold2355_cov267-Chaetoceros_neogracile.AAC.2